MKMPVISDELGMAISAELNSKGGRDELLSRIFTTISEENPEFYKQLQAVAVLAMKHGSPMEQNYLEGVLEGMGFMYHIIHAQMEADEMNEAWGSEGEKE